MGKTKAPTTGKGYLGEIMVHRITGQIGVVEQVVESQTGWPPQITLKLADGASKRGNLSEFKEASAAQKKKFTAPAGTEAEDAPGNS